jgi:murein DD-endopeptidase MepM/ murein hydrolase activator NlpD
MVGYRMPKGGQSDVHLVNASVSSPKVVPIPKDAGPKNQSGRLGWPVFKGTVVSSFGPRSGSFHDGIDIACPIGTPVYASHGGKVIYADNGLGGYGNLVIIRHLKSGFTTVYAHNNRLKVSEGDEVKKGERIADSGNTGHSTGPHLHYEVRVKDGNGRYVAVDPLPLLLSDESKSPSYRINDNLTPLLVKR